jgi:hypothetical protein
MRLVDFLRDKFRDGIQYEDAAQLCLSLYCASDILFIRAIDEELSMDRIAKAFSEISKQGLVRNYSPYKSIIYGANYHSVEDKGHWIEVQASILKLKTTYDVDRVRILLNTT